MTEPKKRIGGTEEERLRKRVRLLEEQLQAQRKRGNQLEEALAFERWNQVHMARRLTGH